MKVSKPTLANVFDVAVVRHAEKEALIYGDERITYRQLQEIVNNLGKCFLKLGINRGDKIGIWMSDDPMWTYSFFAIAKIGTVIVPLNARYREKDVTYLLKHADIKLLVVSDRAPEIVDYVGMVNQIIPNVKKAIDCKINDPGFLDLKYVITVGKKRHLGMMQVDDAMKIGAESGLDAELEKRASEVEPEDLAILQYTSGTTAFPKGCMITHATMVRNALSCALRLELREGKERVFDPMPPFHVVGLCFGVLPSIAYGCCRIGTSHFDPLEALKIMDAERCTLTSGSSTIIMSWMDHKDFSKYDVRTLQTGVIFTPPPIAKRIRETLPNYKPLNIYGLSEVGGNLTTTKRSDDINTAVYTHGKPHDGMKVQIMDPETGEQLAQGQEGEICARGWSIMKGYYKDAEETAKTIDKNGWLHSGDIGFIDENGNLVFKGRMKDVVRVGGENVSAMEVEEFLLQHPKVKYVQVVGAPDKRLEEVVAAFIELKQGESSSQEEIIDFCRGKIASFKIPKYVRFVKEWPMSASKVQKFKLREQIAKELE